MTQVNLHNLSKSYDNHIYAVSNLNLEIPTGSITALLGPSGCGKTTTLKMIAGLLHPSAGDITFNHQSIIGIPAEKRRAAMVFQNHLLFPYMNVADNVGFGLKMRREKERVIQKRVGDMLDLVHLTGFEKRKPKQLSGGQQQRVALARALIVQPHVLLLDEPLSNLDAHLRDEMRELILDIQRQLHITTIVVTHDQEEAVVLANRVALLFDGHLHQYAEPRAFYERPVNAHTARFFGGLNFVPGQKYHTEVDTPLGLFQVRRQSLGDGPVLLTIRPENLRLGQRDAVHNTVEGLIHSLVYVGTHTRFKITVGDFVFEAITDAASSEQYHQGQTVQVYLPPEKIWLVPDE